MDHTAFLLIFIIGTIIIFGLILTFALMSASGTKEQPTTLQNIWDNSQDSEATRIAINDIRQEEQLVLQLHDHFSCSEWSDHEDEDYLLLK